MGEGDPLVSVVIPTIARPHLLPRALRSALEQTLRPIEVIVVVDGPDEVTTQAIRQVDDGRVRMVNLGAGVGLGDARNIGIAQARGRWVALLDDDDEWLPPKLEIQVGVARRSTHPHPIVACRFIDRRIHGDIVLPTRLPAEGEVVSEYLYCRRRLLEHEGVVLPSTILAARELMERVPFRFRNFAHEGSDWLLRAARAEGAGLEFVPIREPLAIRHTEGGHGRMSDMTHWRTSLDWTLSNADLFTDRARAAFVLSRVSLEARRDREPWAFVGLVYTAVRRARPTWTSVMGHLVIWLVPERLRFRIARVLGGHRETGAVQADDSNRSAPS